MKMIRLTQPNDRPMWINADHIDVLHEHENTKGEKGSHFYIREDPYYVKETPEQIVYLMGQGPKPVSVVKGLIPFETTDTSVCPVDPEQQVEIRMRNGGECKDQAMNFRWHNRFGTRDVDIVAYRVVEDK